MEILETDRIYAAGFFDADGYVGVIQNQMGVNAGNFGLRATITNNHRDILQEFQTKFGGHLYAKDVKREEWLHQYNLMWAGKDVKEFLKHILPYLRVKKQQAELAMMFPLRQTGEPKSQEMINAQWKIYEEIKRLKHDKKPIPPEMMKDFAFEEHSEMLRKKQEAIALRLAHPEWSIRQIAEESKVSGTMIHKYLTDAGIRTSKEGWGKSE